MTDHGKWAAQIEETQGNKVTYPMIGDADLNVAKLYLACCRLMQEAIRAPDATAATNATVRTVFMVGPDKEDQTDAQCIR